MIDDERRQLEREHEQGDSTALSRLQALNDRVGLSHDDADYLLAYLDLCERAGKDAKNREYHVEELEELNRAYEAKVGSKTLRTNIPTLDAYDEGYNDAPSPWAASQDCG